MFFKKNPEVVAAIDLGSNSFHMTVARLQNGRLHVLDTLKEMVRLASGITSDHGIDPPTMQRAITCLERFGQRLQDLHPNNVKAIGTNALRRANKASDFLAAAEQALGYKIEIVSGIEEARLIYVGVSHCAPDLEQQTLVVDIGGGSTEIIIGQQFSPQLLDSLYIGCVGMSLRFFDTEKISAKRFQKAILTARQELAPIEKAYRTLGWARAIGASGTIKSIADNIKALGFTDSNITLKALHKLKTRIIDAGSIEKAALPNLSTERAPVFSGGLAVLIAVFEALQIEQMEISHCALREGILCELTGIAGQLNIHTKTIKDACKRYQIDLQHANRVASTCMTLFEQAKSAWKLDDAHNVAMLQYAAQLHEIGLTISHSRYNRHGAYLIENSDLPGFTRQQQTEIATLIRMHRRRLRKEYYEMFDTANQERLIHLAIILRIAVILHRSRSSRAVPDLHISVNMQELNLKFPQDWLHDHPLTEADLEQESEYLREARIQLQYE